MQSPFNEMSELAQKQTSDRFAPFLTILQYDTQTWFFFCFFSTNNLVKIGGFRFESFL